LLAVLALPTSVRADTVGTLTLDSLSFVSFQDEQVLPIPAGARLKFHFGEPSSNGSVSFTIAPADVEIPAIELGPDQTLTYGLAGSASGTMSTTASGRRMSFSATIAATPNEGETFHYAMPFTTESTEATNLAGNVTVEITGMRLVEGVWYVQLVGATVNKENAFPKPGAAVYTVLSGQFDQLPEL
jgi:hypothetical protein